MSFEVVVLHDSIFFEWNKIVRVRVREHVYEIWNWNSKTKHELRARNHVVFRQIDEWADGQTDKVNLVYPTSLGRGIKNSCKNMHPNIEDTGTLDNALDQVIQSLEAISILHSGVIVCTFGSMGKQQTN